MRFIIPFIFSLYYAWIAFKFLHEFPEAVFLMVASESLLGEDEVWSARLV